MTVLQVDYNDLKMHKVRSLCSARGIKYSNKDSQTTLAAKLQEWDADNPTPDATEGSEFPTEVDFTTKDLNEILERLEPQEEPEPEPADENIQPPSKDQLNRLLNHKRGAEILAAQAQMRGIGLAGQHPEQLVAAIYDYDLKRYQKHQQDKLRKDLQKPYTGPPINLDLFISNQPHDCTPGATWVRDMNTGHKILQCTAYGNPDPRTGQKPTLPHRAHAEYVVRACQFYKENAQ